MARVIATYQAQDPGDAGPREAFAVVNDTIMGATIVRASNLRKTGETSFGLNYPESLLMSKAEESVSGFYRTAIEPHGDLWLLTIYEGPTLEPVETTYHQTANDAFLAGRKALAERCSRS